ncbi:MAG: hypothetical protein ABW075_09385, partial [Aeromicrobium sp.]
GSAADADAYFDVRRAISDAIDEGTLPLAVLERAAANVADLGRWADDRSDLRRAAGHARSPLVNTDSIVAAAIRTDGSIPRLGGAVRVLDLRHRATIAVATETDVFTTALAADGASAESLRLAPAPDDASPDTIRSAVSAAPDGLVVIVDRIGVSDPQADAVAVIRSLRPDAVVINVGMPIGDGARVPGPIIETLGNSLAGATVVARMLRTGSKA